MPVYFFRNRLPGYPSPPKPPPEVPNMFRLYELCSEPDRRTSQLYQDVKAIRDVVDKTCMRDTLVLFNEKCHQGMQLEKLYDWEDCHIGHEYRRSDGTTAKIWRIRGGDCRIYFIYAPGPGRRIVILKGAIKRRDQLSAGEELELKNLSNLVLDYLKKFNFEDREFP